MSKKGGDFISLGEAMQEMLQENKLQKGLDQVNVKEAWATVMGKGVFGYTDEILFKNNTLTIRLSSATLREELSYGKEKIIDMMNENLGKKIINKLKLF